MFIEPFSSTDIRALQSFRFICICLLISVRHTLPLLYRTGNDAPWRIPRQEYGIRHVPVVVLLCLIAAILRMHCMPLKIILLRRIL